MPRFAEVAAEAARAGAVVLRRLAETGVATEVKDDRTSLVTVADREAQEAVVRVVRGAYPDHAVIGEEGTAGDPNAAHAWIVDPLDGTTNYAHGIPFSCVSVALRADGDVVAGAVFDPWHDELFLAERDGGATRNGASIAVSATDGLARALVAAQLQSPDAAAIDAHVERLRRLHAVARGVRSPGSPALCLAYVACGRLDAFCEGDLAPWDVAAGALLVAEAGGTTSDFAGRPLSFTGRSDIAATNARLQPALLDVLADLPAAGLH